MRIIHEESFGIIPLIHKDFEWYVLLILHQKGRHWAFPKGHSNPGETPLQSAERELKEETGLEVDRILQETPLVESYQFRKGKDIIRKKVDYFPALVKGELILQEEEIQDARWVLLKGAAKYLTFQESKSMCQTLVNMLHL